MVDSGSICTYINHTLAEKLKLFIIPKAKFVTLADSNQKAKVIGEVVVDLKLQDVTHTQVF